MLKSTISGSDDNFKIGSREIISDEENQDESEPKKSLDKVGFNTASGAALGDKSWVNLDMSTNNLPQIKKKSVNKFKEVQLN